MGFLKSVGKALGKGAPGLNKAITKMTPGLGGMNRALGIAPPKSASPMQAPVSDAQPIPAAAPEGGIGPSEEMVQQTMPVQAPVEAPAPQMNEPMQQDMQNQQNAWAQNAQASQQAGQAAGQNMSWMNRPGAMQGPMGGPQSLQQVLQQKQKMGMGGMAQAGAAIGNAFGQKQMKPPMQQSPTMGRMFGGGMQQQRPQMGGMFGRAMGQNMGSRLGQAVPNMGMKQQKPQQMM
jgi:hypothetical protein